jgi:hypothetical protein
VLVMPAASTMLHEVVGNRLDSFMAVEYTPGSASVFALPLTDGRGSCRAVTESGRSSGAVQFGFHFAGPRQDG